MISSKIFDVIVIGGGHAGIEAACASARMGCNTALITLSSNKIGHMPCNPAVGGIGKGHIVFEIAALGGVMPQLCSKTYLQANMLNKSKGPAVQGLRLQIDKVEYQKEAQKTVENYKNITVIEGTADEILQKKDKDGISISGIKMIDGTVLSCTSLIITTGTFLNGLVHKGLVNFSSGRENEPAVKGLAQSIKNLNLEMGRLKTGTPPRIKKSTVCFKNLEEQSSHQLNYLFEYYQHAVNHKYSCFITRTNKTTHDIILKNAHLSPIYRGEIQGKPPRYCPSIEDKISRFSHKDSHHVFVEPESIHLDEVYPNGLSTSLPEEVQLQFIRTLEGFENAEIARPGYAIEYDFVLPHQLSHTLECKTIRGLFFAGQINGTTGYEEAAGQGIIAGINGAAKVIGKNDFILHREESYIGIMIDDLVTLSVDEPYRMFTSRAERRLILRQDNVFYRLYKKSYDYNLIDQTMYDDIEKDLLLVTHQIEKIIQNKKLYIELTQKISSGYEEEVRHILNDYCRDCNFNSRQQEYIFAEILYYPYYKRESEEIKKLQKYRELIIPNTLDINSISGLSIELKQKITSLKPKTIADASLIQGMTPAALSILIYKSKIT
jgi:tRNA uridine 5-carboxymethylaminomethyl modification enzyme